MVYLFYSTWTEHLCNEFIRNWFNYLWLDVFGADKMCFPWLGWLEKKKYNCFIWKYLISMEQFSLILYIIKVASHYLLIDFLKRKSTIVEQDKNKHPSKQLKKSCFLLSHPVFLNRSRWATFPNTIFMLEQTCPESVLGVSKIGQWSAWHFTFKK